MKTPFSILFAFLLLLGIFLPPQVAKTSPNVVEPMHYWKVLLLVYKSIDADYTDMNGVSRHLTHTMPSLEIEDGVAAFRRYVALVHDGSNAESFVQYDIVYVDRPLTSLTSLGTNLWWPSPTDTHIELSAYVPQNYDSALVLWPQTNFATGQQIPSYWGLGLQPTSWANGATYATVANAPSWMWKIPSVGEPWLHEWLHGVSYYYADKGFAIPTGDADGASAHGYERSSTIGFMAYYHDLMTGNVLENDQLVGISDQAWQTGSILGNRARIFADYFRINSLSNYQRSGSIAWDEANERVQMDASPPSGNRIYTSVSLPNDFTVVGRVNIPQAGTGLYDSVAVALSDGQVEYWGILAYGTNLVERNNISIMKNDTWGSLFPITLNHGWYTVKMQVDRDRGVIQMKVWADGMNEPDWQVTRPLDDQWTIANIGYRHFGTDTTFVDDIYAIEIEVDIENKKYLYLPIINR